MTVQELIKLLRKQDPNARVFFKSPYDPDQYNIDEVIEDNGAVLFAIRNYYETK